MPETNGSARSIVAGASGRHVVPLLYAGYLLSFIDRIIFGIVMKPAKAALGFTGAQLGLLAGAAFAVTYAVASPLGGWLVDRLGRRKLMAAAIAFWSCATFVSGLASGFLAFALLRGAVGVWEAVFNPLAFSLISDAVPRGVPSVAMYPAWRKYSPSARAVGSRASTRSWSVSSRTRSVRWRSEP